MIGKRISDFRILGQLGQGGDVYVAESLDSGHEVVLQLLSPRMPTDRAALQRLESTLRGVAEFLHPNEEVIHKVGEANGRVFVVFEPQYADGLLGSVREIGARLGYKSQVGIGASDSDLTTDAEITSGYPERRTPTALPTRTSIGRTASLSPGQILGQRYRINTQLGSGGMGEVWWALDLKLQVEVALTRIIHESDAMSPA